MPGATNRLLFSHYTELISAIMNKQLVSLIIILNIVIFSNAEGRVPYELPEPVTKNKNALQISVLPQTELISIIQVISRYKDTFGFLMTRDSSVYLTEVNSHFKSFTTHPAVIMFERLSQQPRMLNFSAPSILMLMTDGSLNLRTDIVEDGFNINRIGGKDSLMKFLNLLKDFSAKSSFNDFFNAHRRFYLTVIDTTINSIGPKDYISEIEDFYGTTQESYSIVLVSLYGKVGYGNSLLYPDGRRGIYNTMGPRSAINNVPFFGDEKYLEQFIRHEFSHPFVNPITEKYWSYIKDYAFKYDSIPEAARKNVCGDWQECINEFVIRSVTTYLALNERNEAAGDIYASEKKKGVICLDQLIETIKEYQSDRKSYPTFDKYYFEILKIFKDLR
jgi:hypothetical protein